MISWITNMRVYNFMKSFMTKRVNSILVNLRYLRFKLLKYKENNQKICNTFDHKFKNIPFIMRKVLFCIIQWCPYFLQNSKMALNPFGNRTLHIHMRFHFLSFADVYEPMCATNIKEST